MWERLKLIVQGITVTDETKPKFGEQKTIVAIRTEVKYVALVLTVWSLLILI
jgi:hypothetical protein